jgi:hypothetical protein
MRTLSGGFQRRLLAACFFALAASTPLSSTTPQVLPKESDKTKAPEPPLWKQAVLEVVLYRSGVGSFNHQFQKEKEGSPQPILSFNAADYSHAIQTISSLSDGNQPLAVISRASTLDQILKAAQTKSNARSSPMGNVLDQLRGQAVDMTTSDTTQPAVKGTLVGVESQAGKDSTTFTLNVLTSKGIARVKLDSVTSLKLADARLSAELSALLAEYARGVTAAARAVQLATPASGKSLIATYWHAVTPWQPEYRLFVDSVEDEGVSRLTFVAQTVGLFSTLQQFPPLTAVAALYPQTRLESWAVIENSTAMDWTKAKLTLASGSAKTEKGPSAGGESYKDIDLPRQQSARLQLRPLTGGNLYLWPTAMTYKVGGGSQYPTRILSLLNLSNEDLPGGNLAIHEAGLFAGMVTVDDLPKGKGGTGKHDYRLVTVAEGKSKVAAFNPSIRRGVVSWQDARTTKYDIKNLGKWQGPLTMTLPATRPWLLDVNGAQVNNSPVNNSGISPSQYQFMFNVSAGSSSLTVREKGAKQYLDLLTADVQDVQDRFFNPDVTTPSGVAASLKRFIRFKDDLDGELKRLTSQRARNQAATAILQQSRGELGVVEMPLQDADLRELEKELKALQAEAVAIEREEADARLRFERSVRSLGDSSPQPSSSDTISE